jgi:hypothetical protein
VLRTVAQLMIRKAAPQWLPRCLRLLRTAMTNIRMTRQAKNKLSSNNADANALIQRPRKFQRGAPATLTAGSRLFLHQDVRPFLSKLEEMTTALKIGDPLDEATDIGTIINNKQFTKVCSLRTWRYSSRSGSMRLLSQRTRSQWERRKAVPLRWPYG